MPEKTPPREEPSDLPHDVSYFLRNGLELILKIDKKTETGETKRTEWFLESNLVYTIVITSDKGKPMIVNGFKKGMCPRIEPKDYKKYKASLERARQYLKQGPSSLSQDSHQATTQA